MSRIMHGKRGVIFGIVNESSIAWGIAKQLAEHGAEIILTIQDQALHDKVKPLAEKINAKSVVVCDVSNSQSLDQAFGKFKQIFGKIDFILHSIGFSDKEQLKGKFYNTTLDNFLKTMHISCFSLVDIVKRSAEIMNSGGSILTLSYYGAEKAVPNYNVMGVAKAALESSVRYLAVDMGDVGIRVNAISAGPVLTLAAAQVGGFRKMLQLNKLISPLRRNITPEDLGGAGLYLLSNLSSGVTGEIHYVDAGYNIMGMFNMDLRAELADVLKVPGKAS